MKIEITRDVYAANMHVIHEWVRAHDVVLEDVPVPSTIVIDGTWVTFERYLRNDDGRIYIPAGAEDPARATVTVPLVEPFPELADV
jgi:hypothetical protein